LIVSGFEFSVLSEKPNNHSETEHTEKRLAGRMYSRLLRNISVAFATVLNSCSLLPAFCFLLLKRYLKFQIKEQEARALFSVL